MVFDIDLKTVAGVLLADGWHFIQPGTFRIEEFRFVDSDEGHKPTPPSIGFTFTKVDQITRDVQVYNGPISSLLAVRHDVATELYADDAEDY